MADKEAPPGFVYYKGYLVPEWLVTGQGGPGLPAGGQPGMSQPQGHQSSYSSGGGAPGVGGTGGLPSWMQWAWDNKDTIGKIGLGAYGLWETGKAAKQSKKDSKMARQLAQEALAMYRKSAEDAQARYNMNSPLRDAFRLGVFNYADPTNPFSRGNEIFAPFAQQLQYEGAGPGGPGGVGPGPNATEGQNQLWNMMQKGGVFGSFAPSGNAGGGGGQQNPGIGPITTQPGGPVPPFNPGTQGNMGPAGEFLPPGQYGSPGQAYQPGVYSSGPMMALLAAMQGGARGGGAGRTRSVKGPNINRAQDKGRDRM